jgi:hypothetical protein
MTTKPATLDLAETVLLDTAKQLRGALSAYGPDHLPERMNGHELAHYLTQCGDAIARALADIPPAPNRFRVIPIAEFVDPQYPTDEQAWADATAYACANGLTAKAAALRDAIALTALTAPFWPDYMHGAPRKHYGKLCTRALALGTHGATTEKTIKADLV